MVCVDDMYLHVHTHTNIHQHTRIHTTILSPNPPHTLNPATRSPSPFTTSIDTQPPPHSPGFHLFAITNKKYTVAQLNASAEASTVAEETFGCIRTVRAFAQEDAACRRYDQAVLTTQRWGVAAAQLSGFFGVFSFLVGTGMWA